MSVFKACDVRGLYPDDWNLSDARAIGHSLGSMLTARDQVTIGIGGDFRRTTPEIMGALIDSLVEAGLEVIELGQLPTPVAYFAARKLQLGNLAIVTASHNAGGYNGIKLMVQGRPATPKLIEELERGVGTAPVSRAGGAIVKQDVVPVYEAELADQKTLPEPAILAENGLDVVVDTLGGAAAGIAGRVLTAAGYRVLDVCDTVDPDFTAGAPNPASDTRIDRLRKAVVEEDADVGLAFDGDGDRIIFVTHDGTIVRPEQVAAILMTHCFEQPTVVYDLKCASILPRTAVALGGRAIMRPSGYGYIKETMISEHADLGVEVSGHHFFGSIDGVDDAFLTALAVLGIVSSRGTTLAGLIAPFPWPAITPDLRIPFTGDAADVFERIASSCTVPVSRLDGVRAEFPRGWALARASITEPALTFRFEGRDLEDVRDIVTAFLEPVPDLRETVLKRLESR